MPTIERYRRVCLDCEALLKCHWYGNGTLRYGVEPLSCDCLYFIPTLCIKVVSVEKEKTLIDRELFWNIGRIKRVIESDLQSQII